MRSMLLIFYAWFGPLLLLAIAALFLLLARRERIARKDQERLLEAIEKLSVKELRERGF